LILKLAYTIKRKKGKLTFTDLKLIDQSGNERELTYWLHDYGRLSYWLKKYGKIDGDPLWASLSDIFALEEFIEGHPKTVREKWYVWHIAKLKEIGATQEAGNGTYRLGDFGKLAFEAAKKSSGRVSWSESMESILITYLISKRIENFGVFLSTISRKPIEIVCTSSPKDLSRPKSFQVTWNNLSTCLRNVYFVQVEPPNSVQELKTSSDPLILSTLLLNEMYQAMSNLRERITVKLVDAGSTANPYILTDRGSYEIRRALERLGILQSRFGLWFTSLPDKFLSSSVWYALVKAGKEFISPSEFTEVLKNDFHFLVDTDDVITFLVDSVEYETLGIDLSLLRNNLDRNYSRMLERLVNLGFASIRPDGEARIGAA